MAYKVRISADRSPLEKLPGQWIRSFAHAPGINLAALALLLLLIPATIFLPKLYLAAAIGVLVVSLGAMYLIATTIHARVNGALLTWLLVSPLAYYCFSIPAEKPIFTFDRFVILMLSGAVMFIPPAEATPLPHAIKRAGVVWLVFLAFAFSSLIAVWSDLGLAGTRLITEAFIFPCLIALFVIRVFPAGRYIRLMHTLVGIMAIYCALIGLVEVLTNRDLLPIPGATFYGVDQTGALPRVNGPFDANYCLALIGAITLFLLLFLRPLMDGPVSRGRRWFHWVSITAAITMALLPQFRTLWIALTLVLLLELYHNRRISARVAVVAIVVLVAFAIFSLPALAPAFFQNRIADPSNFYARIAQQQQTWQLFKEHPFNGVGFANFMQAVQGVSITSFHDVDAVNTAHNSLGSILAETGLAGAMPFVVANILWFLAFYRLREQGTPIAALAYRCFLYVFICYWMMGLTLTSAYERDLNLWYMFACALMYKCSMIEQFHRRAATPRPAFIGDHYTVHAS